MTAPIALFVYNRLGNTQLCVKSLAANPLAKQSALYIFSDGPKPGQEFAVAQVREYLKNIKGFASVSIYQNNGNMGCAASVIAGVTQVFRTYETVIVVEDDLVMSADFLDYMNAALRYFGGLHQHVWSISGWGMDLSCDDLADAWLSRRGSSWGWATWRKNWNQVDWNVTDYPLSRMARKKFNRCGADMAHLLDLQMRHKIDSWSIRFDYAQHKAGMKTVYPRVSKVLNLGMSGTHQHGDPGYPVTLDVSGKTEFKFHSSRDAYLDRQFLKYFGWKHKLKNRLRRYVK